MGILKGIFWVATKYIVIQVYIGLIFFIPFIAFIQKENNFHPSIMFLYMLIFGMAIQYKFKGKKEIVSNIKNEHYEIIEKIIEEDKDYHHKVLLKEQDSDKKISVINDLFDVNFEKDYSKSFIKTWNSYQKETIYIKDSISKLHLDLYDKDKGIELANIISIILKSVYLEWFINNPHPPIVSFDNIIQKAYAVAGGSIEKLSTLEMYLSYLTETMLSMININNDMAIKVEDSARRLIPISNSNTSYFWEKKKVLLEDNHYPIIYKLNFLVISIFFMDKYGCDIEGRKKKQISFGEMSEFNMKNELLEEEIEKNKSYYSLIKERKEESHILKLYIETEISKASYNDEDYLENINSLIELIDEEKEKHSLIGR